MTFVNCGRCWTATTAEIMHVDGNNYYILEKFADQCKQLSVSKIMAKFLTLSGGEVSLPNNVNESVL